MHDLADTSGSACAEEQRSPVDVDGSQQFLVLGKWNLRDIIEDDVDTIDRLGDSPWIADIALHEFHRARSIVDVVEIEDSHIVPCREKSLHEQRAEVAAAASDQ